MLQSATKSWHGVKLNQPDWGDSSHSIAMTAELPDEKMALHLIFNSYWEALEFELPGKLGWRRWIDTGLASPDDIVPWEDAASLPGHLYRAESRSVVVLLARI